jgi:hypothetical protein
MAGGSSGEGQALRPPALPTASLPPGRAAVGSGGRTGGGASVWRYPFCGCRPRPPARHRPSPHVRPAPRGAGGGARPARRRLGGAEHARPHLRGLRRGGQVRPRRTLARSHGRRGLARRLRRRPEFGVFRAYPGLSRVGSRRPLRGYALDRPRHGQDGLGIQGGRKTGVPESAAAAHSMPAVTKYRETRQRRSPRPDPRRR